MAFARRTMRCSSSPSLTIFTRSARSAALRKLRFVFTRRLESIPPIRSNDFRKPEDSRYMNAASAEIVKEWVSVAEPNSMSRADLEVNAQRLARALLERKVGKVVILSCRCIRRDLAL